MASVDDGLAVPVWLAEDDLGCIICQGLLAWPVTLPCGHSFCRGCLQGLWGGRHRWSCPTCREGAAQPLRLRKNTLLQDLADKYSHAAGQLQAPPAGPAPPAPRPAPGPPRPAAAAAQPRAAAPKSIPEAGRELAELVERLVDIVRSLQKQRHLPESGPQNKLNVLGMAFSGGVDHSLTSPKLATSNRAEEKMRDILHDLEDIRGKLQESFTLQESFPGKELREEQRQVKAREGLPSSACPRTDQSLLASRFVQWAISPTFDPGTLPCNLEVSEDRRKVTVCHIEQHYAWSHDRFTTCQVLCSQAFSSGQHYWEVDTQQCSHWAVGVASWGMSRDQILGRTTDSWCVEWKGTSQLSMWHMVKETVLSAEKPRVVGIWLDLERGKLAFYSVANQETLLGECPVSASSTLHPAFWLYGLDSGNSLTIRPVKA
ncbi:E3 ubiquitin-protein ligase RNF135 isoform X1 [Pipistrellus kuhlii]|uniref:E3 ubiquitin-protein ligase RNF135 n=1 Tax=Pipistrellus kuhlii TaxID=59472 RepID=A0A7J7TL08_PIPKU|nr:E3 ubiquitin-protein ligase RNF135 isoform X1 [Pipistrellus kuhlii]KAF6301185.1 ring finger protein 135 [Pipistrellus kuhlii]